jgi:hypothetical protein
MTIKESIKSQYRASLAMLQQAIEGCSEEMWLDRSYVNACWNIAYHTLFFTHFYLNPTEEAFKAWENHKLYYQEFSNWPEPYTRAQVLDYLAFCLQQVYAQVDALDLDAPSGFPWLPFDKLELQFYNIRHIMLHTGELCERLGSHGEVAFMWVARGTES